MSSGWSVGSSGSPSASCAANANPMASVARLPSTAPASGRKSLLHSPAGRHSGRTPPKARSGSPARRSHPPPAPAPRMARRASPHSAPSARTSKASLHLQLPARQPSHAQPPRPWPAAGRSRCGWAYTPPEARRDIRPARRTKARPAPSAASNAALRRANAALRAVAFTSARSLTAAPPRPGPERRKSPPRPSPWSRTPPRPAPGPRQRGQAPQE